MNINIYKMFYNKTILITGGSGSWGNELTKQLLEKSPRKIIIFSRGEISQVNMNRKFNDPRLEFVIGDVRDKEAVGSVFNRDIDFVFHLAALKHVPICENQPQEAIKTNIDGTNNVIQYAIKHKVQKFILVSTDKAVDPNCVYGMTKSIAERLVVQANCLTKDTEFLCVRGGNVLGSNGSLVPYVIEQIKRFNQVKLTDRQMTRFFLTLPRAISLLFFAVEVGIGGEIYVMNMPSFRIIDLFHILIKHYGNEDTKIEVIGNREGEKIHESLISKWEMVHTRYVNEYYFVIYPQMNVNRDRVHIWDHIDNKELLPMEIGFTSQDNIKDEDYLKKLLIEGDFLI